MTVNHGRKFFLAIRHKPSGGFLPSVNSYGFTRTEPTKDHPPRLFTKQSAATQALNAWLEGEWFETEVDVDNSIFGEETKTTRIRVQPVAGRTPAAMEIVEIELVVRSLSEAKLRLL